MNKPDWSVSVVYEDRVGYSRLIWPFSFSQLMRDYKVSSLDFAITLKLERILIDNNLQIDRKRSTLNSTYACLFQNRASFQVMAELTPSTKTNPAVVAITRITIRIETIFLRRLFNITLNMLQVLVQLMETVKTITHVYLLMVYTQFTDDTLLMRS